MVVEAWRGEIPGERFHSVDMGCRFSFFVSFVAEANWVSVKSNFAGFEAWLSCSVGRRFSGVAVG